MYDRQEWYDSLRHRLQREDKAGSLKGKYVLLLQVELGLNLLEELGLNDEPIEVLWTVLSGLNFPGFEPNEAQRRMLAHARVLLPYRGRTNWDAALREYQEIPQAWRAYDIVKTPRKCDATHRAHRTGNHINRFDRYKQALTHPIPSKANGLVAAKAHEVVSFNLYTVSGVRNASFTMTPQIASFADTKFTWFGMERERSPLTFKPDEWLQAAEEMDRLSSMIKLTFGLPMLGRCNLRFPRTKSDGCWLNGTLPVRFAIH